jgi:hypothetical protein
MEMGGEGAKALAWQEVEFGILEYIQIIQIQIQVDLFCECSKK